MDGPMLKLSNAQLNIDNLNFDNSEKMLQKLFTLQHEHPQMQDKRYGIFETVIFSKNGDCECILFSEFPPFLVEAELSKYELVQI